MQCSQAPLLSGFSAAGFRLDILDASNSAAHRAQRAGNGNSAALLNLVTVQAVGYRHGVLSSNAAIGTLGSLGFGAVSATFRQMD